MSVEKMEAVTESDREEQLRSGDLQEEEEEEEEEDEELQGPPSDGPGSLPQQLLRSLGSDLYPESYKTNSPDEVRLLALAHNFQRQYLHLYPDRKPLLLCPINEFGQKKFVSTSLRPTLTAHPELFTWEGSASFVADFLSLEPLEPPVDLPRYLFSSSSVLQTQRASCFEFATLLCSLLLGANYDAYCVSGYAVREMCLLDQSWQDCPLLVPQPQSESTEEEQQENKYTMKPLKEAKSHFLTKQEKKKQEAEAALLQKQKLQEERRQLPADALRALRVHCWVLVLAGSRGVQENFFIDPLTGISYSTDHEHFLGIESVWNDFNYYVNMQYCGNGCGAMLYDLEDLNLWEPVLFGTTSKKQLILDVLKENEMKMMSKKNKDVEEEEVEREPRVLQMPRSWVGYINISKKDLEDRWPGRQKTTCYRKAKLERFAAYLRPDGLVSRLTTYRDLDCAEVTTVKEKYQHRTDGLEEREVNAVDACTTERFRRGRPFHLLYHKFETRRPDAAQEMEFSDTRIGHLVRRVVRPGQMTETFQRRPDFLHHRHIVFDRDTFVDPDARVLQVVERFHRDGSKPANEDVAERTFLPTKGQIKVKYHLDHHRVIPSTRTFIKSPQTKPHQETEKFTADMVSGFQVDPSVKPLRTSTLYKMLLSLIKDEENIFEQVEESKQEVRDIMACREREEGNIELNLSPWSTAGAARARVWRQERERMAVEEQRWLQEKEKDLLAPVMIRLDRAETLSSEDATQIYQQCLAEFKQRLVEHAGLIQERYDKETQELQRKQQWYQNHQFKLLPAEEEEYQAFCSEKTLQIHVTKMRLRLY